MQDKNIFAMSSNTAASKGEIPKLTLAFLKLDISTPQTKPTPNSFMNTTRITPTTSASPILN